MPSRCGPITPNCRLAIDELLSRVSRRAPGLIFFLYDKVAYLRLHVGMLGGGRHRTRVSRRSASITIGGMHMNRFSVVMLATATLMASAALADGQQAVTKDKIIGTWKALEG